MPTADVVVSCPVYDSFRVQQVAGMFDAPLAEKSTHRFRVELPGRSEPWEVGLITGPSGSGKSTVARRFFERELCRPAQWPANRAVIDCFGDLSTTKIAELFTAVGFSSPPSWVKPYRVLSCGEQFRCNLARALAPQPDGRAADDSQRGDGSRLVVFDEFTSVVDRSVAKACSAAIAKGVRRGWIDCRFVAVTCHSDVAEWLEADWVLDMASGRLDRRRLRRPVLQIEIHRCAREAWQLFARHHYLSGSLARGARCYLASWNGQPVTFCATVPLIARIGRRRFTRIVTLPDYQGLGIGMRVVAAVAQLHAEEGLRTSVTASHPAVIRHCKRSPLWRAARIRRSGATSRTSDGFSHYRASMGRSVVSFEFLGDR